MNVLVLNAGSSSLKFQIIATDLEHIKEYKDDRVLRGEIDGIGGVAVIKIRYRTEPAITLTAPLRDMGAALDYLLRYIASDRSGIAEIRNPGDVNAVGHRVVHGGELFKESSLIDDRVLKGIEDCIDLAQLHIAAIEVGGGAKSCREFLMLLEGHRTDHADAARLRVAALQRSDGGLDR